jgi:hypothetical protein
VTVNASQSAGPDGDAIRRRPPGVEEARVPRGARTPLIEAAGHPLRVVRSYVAFRAADLGDAALITAVRNRLPPAERTPFLSLRRSQPSDLTIPQPAPGTERGGVSARRGIIIP